ncbi:transmembrane amino acid transporter protein-domain-containing protein [Mucor mucedo]|uniref:transmembrane amino acid transporter protein-domain-containing protein n=1 Tax=Mucor mucedo TaxID=29922 RepID=UPI00221FFF63|nr:transmembrane amino acid transporter protein-domain-containing protein [Mucor mucedo]KAI7890008.1 transmembrane amino acid transporter protein-domain-containing protein [Mucor mucedo]
MSTTNNNFEVKPISSPDSNTIEKYKQENQYDNSFCEEQLEHVPKGTASFGRIVFMLLKAFIGTGVIFLPGSFVNGGLALSIVLMIVIAIICLAAYQLLVKAQNEVGGSYGDVAQHLYGAWLRHISHLFICLTQMGFVASYFIFISGNVNTVVNTLNNCNTPFESKYYIWIFLAFMIPFCWVRKIARLSWLAILADVFISFGLICVIYFSSTQIAQHGVGNNIHLVNPNNFGLMIGTAVFSYEGIGMVLPILEGMKEPEKFPRALNIAMLICTLVFLLIGCMGYIAYGDMTQATVVANFPRMPLSVTVQLLYAIAMTLSSPFMLYPPLTIIENYVFGNRSGKNNLKIKMSKNLVRTLVVTVCAIVSFCVGASNLDKFVSLVGSVACMPISFIFPGLFHYKIATKRITKIGDIALIVFGFGILIYTMYVNIDSWVNPVATGGIALPSANACGYE